MKKNMFMTERIPITKDKIRYGHFYKDKKYVLKDDLYIYVNSPIIYSFDIDLLVEGSLDLENLFDLKSISENVTIGSSENFHIDISFCPKLKTLPTNLIAGRKLYLSHNQHLITILSKEQVLSLKELIVSEKYYWSECRKITSYEEYYSLIKDTLIKNNLLKVCAL